MILIGGFWCVLCVSVFQGSLLVIIIIMQIDGGEKTQLWRWLLNFKVRMFLKSPVIDGKSIVNTGCSSFRVNFSPSLPQIFLCFLFSSTFTFYWQEVLDAHGCELRCSVMSDASQENQFIVARKEVSLLPSSSEHYENDMCAKSAKYMLQTLNIIKIKPFVKHYFCP